MKYALRPYQQTGVDRVMRHFEDGEHRVLLVAPTGAGKTVVAANIIEQFVAQYKRVLFLAHREELIEQCSKKLTEIGLNDLHGCIKAGHWRDFPSRPVQVASVQTLSRRLATTRNNFDLIITDETHHCVSASYEKIYAWAGPDVPHLGLTATPYRLDGKGLGKCFDHVVELPTPRWLTANGFLVPCFVYGSRVDGLDSIRKKFGDYDEAELTRLMNTKILNGKVVENWLKFGQNRKTILFAVDCEHARGLCGEFNEHGIGAVYVDGKMSPDARRAAFKRFAEESCRVICNVGVAVEGYDNPEISCIVAARPTKSRQFWRQAMGRTLRPFEGKQDSICIDHAGWIDEHGEVTDDDEWSLSTGLKKEKRDLPEPHPCRYCKLVVFGRPEFCPHCRERLRDPSPPRLIAHTDDELVLRSGGLPSVAEDWTDPKGLKYRELNAEAYINNYKPAWADVQFRQLFGQWPSKKQKAYAQHQSQGHGEMAVWDSQVTTLRKKLEKK